MADYSSEIKQQPSTQDNVRQDGVTVPTWDTVTPYLSADRLVTLRLYETKTLEMQVRR